MAAASPPAHALAAHIPASSAAANRRRTGTDVGRNCSPGGRCAPGSLIARHAHTAPQSCPAHRMPSPPRYPRLRRQPSPPSCASSAGTMNAVTTAHMKGDVLDVRCVRSCRVLFIAANGSEGG